MKTPKRILVPTDLSVFSLEAMRQAEDIADPVATEIIVLHALETGGGHRSGQTELQAETVELEVRKNLIHLLAKHRMIRRNLRIELTWQSPVLSILEAIARYQVDLVVMATHGRTGVSRALLGSVAEEVVRYSPVPVLTVKLHEQGSTTLSEEDIRHHLHLN